MYKYLDKVREKPLHHKKRFALLASSTITMFILGVWSFAMFGVSSGSVVAQREEEGNSPLQSLTANVGSAFNSFKQDFDKVVESVESIDLEEEYGEMRQDAVETYER